MGRGPPELGCPQSQGFVDVEHEEHLLIAKRSFRRVHRDHADAPPLRLRYARASLTNSKDLCPSRIVLATNGVILQMVKIVRIGF